MTDPNPVADEPGFARTYDEDELIELRMGDVRAVLDVATMSMDFASGFLDNEQVEALRQLATVLRIDPLFVTPHNFVCRYTGTHQWVPQRGWFPTRLTDEERAALAEQDARYAEILADLDAAKIAARADKTEENLAALDAAKRAANDFRSEVRAARAIVPTERGPMGIGEQEPTIERCGLCGATRPIENNPVQDV